MSGKAIALPHHRPALPTSALPACAHAHDWGGLLCADAVFAVTLFGVLFDVFDDFFGNVVLADKFWRLDAARRIHLQNQRPALRTHHIHGAYWQSHGFS